MRRVIILLVLLAAVGAAVWFFMTRAGGGGAPPTLAAQLDKTHTIALASVESPADLLTRLLDVANTQTLPPEAKAGLAPEARTQALGFDPATAAGWQSIGVDPTAGVGIAVDARITHNRPFLIAKITDEAKFLAWIGKQVGGEAKIADDRLTAGTKTPLAVAKRGGFTFIGEHMEPAELKAVVEAKVEPLSGAAGFDAAFAGAKAGGRVTGFVPVANLGRMPPMAGGVAKQSVDFYAELFPAIGAVADAGDFRVRVATTEKGTAALKQVFAPGKSAPGFAKWLPAEGFAVMRYSVNLKELFVGIQALLPPAVPEQVRMQLGLAPMALGMIGIDWAQVTEAFSGHFAFAIKPEAKGGMPEVVVLMALGNGAKADALITSLQGNAGKLLKGMGGGRDLPITDVEVDGAKGKRADVMGQSLFLVRKDDMLIFASGEQLLKDTLARAGGKPSLAGTPAGGFIDGDAIFAGTMNIASMVPPGAPEEIAALLKGMPPIEAAVRLDRHGLAFEGKTISLAMGLGASVFLVMNRSRDAMERMEAVEAQAIEARKMAEAAEADAAAAAASAASAAALEAPADAPASEAPASAAP